MIYRIVFAPLASATSNVTPDPIEVEGEGLAANQLGCAIVLGKTEGDIRGMFPLGNVVGIYTTDEPNRVQLAPGPLVKG